MHVQECQEQAQQERESEAAASKARELRLAPLKRTATALAARGYRMTRPQFGFQQTGGTALPWLDDRGILHFPVLLFYPEATPYHDTIQDCTEHDCIGDHIGEARFLCCRFLHTA